MAHRVVLIPGDGTGPELTEATRRVLEATGVELEWDVRDAGADVMERHGGNPLPPEVLDAIRETGVAPKRPPQGDGRAQGEHHEVHRRALAARRARGRG